MTYILGEPIDTIPKLVHYEESYVSGVLQPTINDKIDTTNITDAFYVFQNETIRLFKIEEISDFHLIYEELRTNHDLRRLQLVCEVEYSPIYGVLLGVVWVDDTHKPRVFLGKDDYDECLANFHEAVNNPLWITFQFENRGVMRLPFGYVPRVIFEDEKQEFYTYAKKSTKRLPKYEKILIEIDKGVDTDPAIAQLYDTYKGGTRTYGAFRYLNQEDRDIITVSCEGQTSDTTLERVRTYWCDENINGNNYQHHYICKRTGNLVIMIHDDSNWAAQYYRQYGIVD